MGALLSLLLLVAAAPPPAIDTRAALGAVIAHEARVLGAGRARAGCVRPLTTGATFGAIRNFNASDSSDLPMVIPSLDWRELSGGAMGGPVSEAKRQALDAGVRAIVTSPPVSAPAERIERAGLASPLRLCLGRSAGTPSRSAIALRSPSFGEGFAFVGLDANCGLLCGSGRLYALERRGAAWEIVAVVGEWGG